MGKIKEQPREMYLSVLLSAIERGAIVRRIMTGDVHLEWLPHYKMEDFEVCLSYCGADSSVWEYMKEVK